jgi:hypothetical protein
MGEEHDDSVPDSSGEFQELWGQAAPLMPLPPNDSPQLYPGLELWGGRFQIVRRIGAGGMGVVHEAHDRERGENVALKTLSRMDAASIYRMKNEFRALAEVIHPNLVRLHELFADRRLWLFTMELIRGEPFLSWVRPKGELDVRRLRHGLSQIVAGVRTIHDAGKLHRDLKPSNVLVTTNDRIVILDFGLVADPELGGPGQTMADDRVSGTPSYISPEQAAGDAPTTASDWYGVGVLLFEALTGRMPFPDRGYVVMQRKQSVEPPAPRSIAPGVPEDLDALCVALLSRVPELRPTGEQIAAVVSVQRPTPAPHAPPISISPPRPETPAAMLVGREAEFGALRDAFAAAAAGQATLARVTGESGAGKSALIRAFLDELRVQGRAVVLSGRCYERESVPYKAIDRVIDALTRFLRQLPDLEMATLMPRDIGALARIFPVLERIELVAAAPARSAPDDAELRRRAFDAFADLLAGIRDRHMLVLHIDDMQWIDHDSVLLLEHLLSQPDPPPLLLIAGHRGAPADNPLLARIDQAVRGNRAVGLREIAVGPLSPLAASDLSARLLAAAHGDPALAGAVAAEAAGNPFFIVELSRYAALAAARGEPAAVSLGDAIRKRAADLGGAARRLLELLAISGRPTPGEVLVRAASAGDDAHHALDLLRAAQLLREGGGRTYECYHDRIREALTERLAPDVARDYHLRLATAWAERENADPELLFEHWRAAGQDARAASCAIEAGQKAASNLAFERSAAFYGHAAGLLPEGDAQRLELLEKRAEALSLAGRWAEAAQAFAESEAHAAEPAKRAHLLHRAAVHFLGSGQSAEGLPRLQRLFALNGIPWPTSRVGAGLIAFVRLSWLWLRGAKRPKAPAPTSAAEAVALEHLLEGAGLVPPYDIARGVYFMTAFAMRGLRCADTAYVAVASGMLATLFSASRFSRALSRRMAEEAGVLARRATQQPDLASAALSFVGYAHLIGDRTADALALGVEAENLVRDSSRAHIYQTWTARSLQAGALLVLGRVGEMAALCERNARLAREVGDEMAMIGGDSPLRFLLSDDVARARALIDQKLEVIARAKDHGVLHQIVHMDQVLCSLYAGRGADVVRLAAGRGEGLSQFFDPSMLAACAAIQASPHGDAKTRKRVDKTIRGLRRNLAGPANEAMALQLEAVLLLFGRDAKGAIEKITAAAQRYAAAGMALHEALMLYRLGRLRGGADGERAVEQARRFMSAQGIVRPEGWARMLAPGLE